MTRDQLLLSRLECYAASDAVPMHMPGHKRRTDTEMLRMFPNPFLIDITEIDGFDNLHHPEGILKDSMEWAASVYGADHTWYLVNGSTAGILSAICCVSGSEILMARNSHKSAYHGAILHSLKTRYVYPQLIGELGINGGISVDEVDALLSEYSGISAVFLTSPTYDGIVSDVRAIAESAHRHGVPLIVDEAHGAHFPFGESLPESALSCGADVVIQSLHKTLPSLTQTAVIHLKGGRIPADRLERYLQIFQSSSPSYVFLASIEKCIYEMWKHGNEEIKQFDFRIRTFRERLTELKHLRLLGREWIGQYGVYEIDWSKIVISCKSCRKREDTAGVVTGEMLGQWLRETYQIEMEMCGADYVVAITTFLDRQEHLDRLADAFLEIDRELVLICQSMRKNLSMADSASGDGEMVSSGYPTAVTVECMADAVEECWDEVAIEDSLGRISAEFAYVYPPGIPILAPGERMTEEISRLIKYNDTVGLSVQGMSDPSAKRIRVVSDRNSV